MGGQGKKKTLVLDIDETLLHSSSSPTEDYEHLLNVSIEGYNHVFYVSLRPGVQAFLQLMSQHFEIVLFTASLRQYASEIRKLIDPTDSLIDSLLCRAECTMVSRVYVKQLNRIDRPIQDIIILDVTIMSIGLEQLPLFLGKH